MPVLLLTLTLTASALEAQLPRPSVAGRTFLSLGGGLTFGPGTLWTNNRQPLLNPNLTPPPGGGAFVDTMVVSSSVENGSSFLLSMTRFASNSVGFGTDFAYHGFRKSRNCRVVFDSAAPLVAAGQNPLEVSSPNLSACDDVRQAAQDGATLDLMPFLIWRIVPGSEITPALKAGGGLSFVPCTVRINSPQRDLINGECTSTMQPMWGVAVGVYRQTDIEAQFHFELRYSVHRWGVVNGLADLNGNATVGREWHGGFGFSMGVDFQV